MLTKLDRVFVIAEAGVNHNGSLDMAYKLVDEAKKAGVDAVKFQTGKPEKVVAKWASKAEYQKANTGNNEAQLDMIKKIALENTQFLDLKKYCEKAGILFFSTPFEIDALHYLVEIGMRIIKVPSGEITNLPLLRQIARYAPTHEIIMSTGMADLNEIRDAFNVLTHNGKYTEGFSILHCNTEYPTPYQDVNLRAMDHLQREFNVTVGYSDHTKGLEVPVAAVALGARIIEKHFTLDRNLPGPDHVASLEPHELKKMTEMIRHTEEAIRGSAIKTVSPSEEKNILIARRSIVANTSIKKGERFSELNLTAKRPASGISPMKWDEVVGKIASKDFAEDDLITLD